MSFLHKRSWGDHTVYGYDQTTHPFVQYFTDLFEEKHLDMLHLQSDDYNRMVNRLDLGVLNDRETDLHKKFYTDIKNKDTFKRIYCSFIRQVHKQFFPEEKALIYQSFPSVRFQFMKSVAVPPHCDSDHIGKHPLGEKNFLVPITRMFGSNTLFIESKPGKKDFKPVILNPGEFFAFNGNTCVHHNENNETGKLRISLDFRVMLLDDYKKYLQQDTLTTTNPRDPEKSRVPVKMVVGGYYQVYFPGQSLQEMMKWYKIREPIVQSRPNFGDEEAKACAEYFSRGGYITEYGETKKLERQICDYTGAKHCVMTTSGTTALIASLTSLGITRGDEVIVPNYTIVVTANVVKAIGAIPIIVDVHPDSLTLSWNEVEPAITPKTKAVIHVSLNNHCLGLEKLVNECKKRKLHLVEDAAQSVGCFHKGKHLGTYGIVGTFSLSTPKIISTGQGGIIVTDNDTVAKNARAFKNFGRRFPGDQEHKYLGLNFKYTDLQAVICQEQFKKLPERTTRMREIFELYYENISDIVGIQPAPSDEWIPWFVTVLVSDREEIMAFLKHHNICTRPAYSSVADTGVYNGTQESRDYPISRRVAQNGLFLPTHSLLTDNDVMFVCAIIKLHSLLSS
jgi:perosamine synthetase